VLPFAQGADELAALTGYDNALDVADAVTFEAPLDESTLRRAVQAAVLIERPGPAACAEVESVRATPLPWGSAAISARLREVWPQLAP
jgi:hypothetical protein